MAIIQVRGISERAHRALTERALARRQSLSEYLRVELERLAEEPTLEEALARVAAREPVAGESAATAIHAERRAAGHA
jgi:hypothetical protein